MQARLGVAGQCNALGTGLREGAHRWMPYRQGVQNAQTFPMKEAELTMPPEAPQAES